MYEDARRGRAGRADGNVHRGDILLGAARDRRRPSPTSTLSAVEEARQTSLGRYEGYLRRLGALDDAAAEQVKTEALELMRAGIAAAEGEPPADPELIFEYAYAVPPPNLREGWLG